jgi:hypothetical protein
MSTARGYANHHLYMASLLIEAWQREGESGSTPALALQGAFVPAIRLHLLDAYGWFLLALTRTTSLPSQAPHGVEELPSRPAGMGIPGEISEFRQLEQTGWIADLRAPLPLGMPRRQTSQSLAASVTAPDLPQCRQWCDDLRSLFDRMGDSLEEY